MPATLYVIFNSISIVFVCNGLKLPPKILIFVFCFITGHQAAHEEGIHFGIFQRQEVYVRILHSK